MSLASQLWGFPISTSHAQAGVHTYTHFYVSSGVLSFHPHISTASSMHWAISPVLEILFKSLSCLLSMKLKLFNKTRCNRGHISVVSISVGRCHYTKWFSYHLRFSSPKYHIACIFDNRIFFSNLFHFDYVFSFSSKVEGTAKLLPWYLLSEYNFISLH